MTSQLRDKTGAPVTIELDEDRSPSAYTVHVGDGRFAGRADFVDTAEADGTRIFFHTEIAPDLGGRGLAGILVSEALADSRRKGLTVVPVCPLFAAHLDKHGAWFLADGGRFRLPTRSDLDLVADTVAGVGNRATAIP